MAHHTNVTKLPPASLGWCRNLYYRIGVGDTDWAWDVQTAVCRAAVSPDRGSKQRREVQII